MIGEYRDDATTPQPDDWLVRQETVWLGDIPVGVIKKPTATGPIQVHYIHTDHLNTARVIVDQSNTIVWRWDNSHAFGANLPDESPTDATQVFEYNLRFPGQYFDKETNLHYNYFRYYEPETGRYISPDPIGLMGGVNVWGYVGQNPLGFVDYSGLSTALVDRDNNTISVTFKNGQVVTYAAGNNTINPSGGPNKIGSNGPAPVGIWPVQLPINTSGDIRYGPYFWPIGAVDASGNRADIARQRGIGLHGGRRSYQSRTEGCIRMNDGDILDLFKRTINDPLTTIEIR